MTNPDQPELADQLVTERVVSRTLLLSAMALARQLALADGGDVTTVRAALSLAMDQVGTLPHDPAAFGVVADIGVEPMRQALAAAKIILVEQVTQILQAAAAAAPGAAPRTRQ